LCGPTRNGGLITKYNWVFWHPTFRFVAPRARGERISTPGNLTGGNIISATIKAFGGKYTSGKIPPRKVSECAHKKRVWGGFIPARRERSSNPPEFGGPPHNNLQVGAPVFCAQKNKIFSQRQRRGHLSIRGSKTSSSNPVNYRRQQPSG